MDILDIINQPVEEREEIVEYKDTKYLFRASSDASEQLESYMASEVEMDKWAKHCSVVTCRAVKPEMARWCHMVRKTLQPVAWNEVLGTWEPRKLDNGQDKLEWDIVEIVMLSQRIGTDFLTVFLEAAQKVLGTDKTAAEIAGGESADNTFHETSGVPTSETGDDVPSGTEPMDD